MRAGRIRQHLQQAHGTGPRWAQLHLHALGAIALFKRGQRDELDAMPLATALPTSIPPAGREDRCLRISDCLRTSDELCATRERPPWASPARLPPPGARGLLCQPGSQETLTPPRARAR